MRTVKEIQSKKKEFEQKIRRLEIEIGNLWRKGSKKNEEGINKLTIEIDKLRTMMLVLDWVLGHIPSLSA